MAQPATPPHRSNKSSRGPIIAATAATLLVVAAGVALALSLESLIRDRIIEEAARRGFVIDPGTVNVWFGSATLEDTSIRLEGVDGLRAHAKTIDVLLDGLTPTRVDVAGVDASLKGSAPDLALQSTAWTARHPSAYEAPFSAKAVGVVWRSEAGQDPWLQITDGQFSRSAGGLRFATESATVIGVPVGAVGATWDTQATAIQMHIGAADPKEAPLRIDVEHEAQPPRATFQLRRLPLQDLSGPLGVTLPVDDDVMAEGAAELVFPDGFEKGPITGSLDANLLGYVPPHPIELGGFFFGDSTQLSTKMAISADRRAVTLTDTRVAAGSFRLRGEGQVQREGDHAIISMTLRGALPCGQIADSAAKARAGSVLGKLLGDAAKRVMKGSVEVRVSLVADTRALDEARVKRSIGIGCGLKPLELSDLEELGLPKRGREVAEELSRNLPKLKDELAKQLPRAIDELSKRTRPVPSSMPALPSSLPPLELPPLPEAPKRKEKKKAPQ